MADKADEKGKQGPTDGIGVGVERTMTLRLGSASVTVMNVGDIQEHMVLDVPEDERFPGYQALYEQPEQFPFQCVHIALPGASVMVDPTDYAASLAGFPFAPPSNYTPPPDLMAQLRAGGIEPAAVTHVVVTHAHFDHYNGITVERDGARAPTFPNARCFAGRADWDSAEGQQTLREEAASTMSELFQRDMVTLVEGDCDLLVASSGADNAQDETQDTARVCLIATPGESPGHLVVRVQSGGQTLYCVGDLFHHSVEAERPTWRVRWADAQAILASRRALLDAALAEDAYLVAAHIAGIGRLQRTASGATWVTV
jgi:glyoxylase-like metal-dependent hydrolase (beta-lactamase superfamily II)